MRVRRLLGSLAAKCENVGRGGSYGEGVVTPDRFARVPFLSACPHGRRCGIHELRPVVEIRMRIRTANRMVHTVTATTVARTAGPFS